jgi:hypothetical protein
MTEAEIKEQLSTMERSCYEQWWKEIVAPNLNGRKPIAPKVYREQREWVFDAELNKITSAQVDVAYVAYEFVLVLDYKTGYKPTTPAQRNFQAKVQAVAIANEHGCTHARVAIAQHRFTSMLTQADYDEEALQRAHAEILFDDYRSKQPEAARTPGYWCDYCPAKARCREANVYAAMPVVLAAQNNVPAAIPQEQINAIVAQMQSPDLVFMWRRSGTIVKILEAVKTRLKGLPADELSSMGLTLSEGRNQSEVKDAAGLFEYLQAENLVQESEVMACVEVVFGRVEELALKRLVQRINMGGGKTSQSEQKTALRKLIQEKGWIIFDAKKTSPSLKEIA